MTTHITGDPAIPDPDERAARNAALFADNIETGFWDDQGRPAPGPDDIGEWTPGTNEPAPRTPASRPSSGHDSKTQPSHHSQGPRPFASSLHSSQAGRAATWRSMGRC